MKCLVAGLLSISGVLFLLAGCSPTLHPRITVSQNVNSLIISGTGFSNTNPCAQLSLLNLPPPIAVAAIDQGQVPCSGGSFQKNWQFADDTCPPSRFDNVTVSAVDDQTSNPAGQTISFNWSPTCGLAGICGGEGLPLCGAPPTCFSQQCSSSVCKSGLNPNLNGSQLVCTATCGYTQGAQAPCASLGSPDCGGAPLTLLQPFSACNTQKSFNNQLLNIFTCYGDSASSSLMDNTCVCVPNTINNANGDTSDATGTNHQTSGQCVHAQYTIYTSP